MLFSPISLLAPHFCCSCDEIGSVLCESCIYDIISEPETLCLNCRQPIGSDGRCSRCALPYSRAWAAGVRSGGLERLIDATKFESVRAGCAIQARLLDQVLPVLPAGAVIVPVPTIRTHIRQRGYDHSLMIARELAKRRGATCSAVVKRRGHSVQHGATRSARRKQAADSYWVDTRLAGDATYVIVDDVFTTGYTVQYMARALRAAGAGDVWVAVTARQPWSEPRQLASDGL